jgi:hypothetical protein
LLLVKGRTATEVTRQENTRRSWVTPLEREVADDLAA